MSRACALHRDERGIILPLTMIALIVLGTLVSALLALGTTEPQIAANLVRGAQALSLAEAGVERAIAAFNAPASSLMPCVMAAMNEEEYPTQPTGCSTGPVTLYEHATVGAEGTGTYTVTYRPTSFATLMLESTGCQQSATCPNASSVQRVVRVIITRQYASQFAILATAATVTGNALISGNVGAVHGNGSVNLAGSEYTQQTATTAGDATTCVGCDNAQRVGDVANSGPGKPEVAIPDDVPGDYLGRATIVLGGSECTSNCPAGGGPPADAVPIASTGCQASAPLTYVVPAQGNNPAQTVSTAGNCGTGTSGGCVPPNYILNVAPVTVGGTTTVACTLTRQNTGPFNGWSMSNTAGDWSLSGGSVTPPDGAYYAPVGIRMANNTSPGSAGTPWRATLIAGTSADTGEIDIAGSGHIQAFLNGLAMIAGNIRITGTPTVQGTLFATSTASPPPGFQGNLYMAGNASLRGNVIARRNAYVTGSAGTGGLGTIVYNVPTRTRLLSPNLRIVSWNAISTLD